MHQQCYIIFVGSFVILLLSIIIPYVFHFYNINQRNNNNNDDIVIQSSHPKCLPNNEILFTVDQLAQYTEAPSIFLAFLGIVYNVTSGHYYHPNGSYEFFAGKDGTRAFLTGIFTAEELRDDITDLDESYLKGMDNWIRLYQEKYARVGLLIGSYYDYQACPTKKLRQVQRTLKRLAQSKQMEDDDLLRYPPCNSQWDATVASGRVWCTNLSGGISRKWIGKPRLFYDLHAKKWRCACVENDQNVQDFCHQLSSSNIGMEYEQDSDNQINCRFKYYKNCDPDSTECQITD